MCGWKQQKLQDDASYVRNVAWYAANRGQLKQQHPGKWIAIRAEAVVGVYESCWEANEQWWKKGDDILVRQVADFMYRFTFMKDGKVVLVVEQDYFDDPAVWSGDPELIRRVKACWGDGYSPHPKPPDMHRCSNFYAHHRDEGYTVDYQHPWRDQPLLPVEPGTVF